MGFFRQRLAVWKEVVWWPWVWLVNTVYALLQFYR
jgi:hypothetical protein